MLTLVTGNLEEAIQEIKPDVLLNISTASGTGLHCLSGILYRNYPIYTTMLNRQKHFGNLHPKQWTGRYVWGKETQDDTVHVLSFIEQNNGTNTHITDRNARQILNILQSIASDMEQGEKKSILLPYCGLQQSGYRFNDFIDLIESVFPDPIVKIYIAVSSGYLERSRLPQLVFTRPTGANPTKRTIYAGNTRTPLSNGWILISNPACA